MTGWVIAREFMPYDFSVILVFRRSQWEVRWPLNSTIEF